MNTRNILKLRNHLAAQPDEKFNMADYYTKATLEGKFDAHGSIPAAEGKLEWFMGQCGTAACIAGHAAVLFGADGADMLGGVAGHLGLSRDDAHRLAIPVTENYRFNARPGERRHITREHAVRTLTRLAETGEVAWEASA